MYCFFLCVKNFILHAYSYKDPSHYKVQLHAFAVCCERGLSHYHSFTPLCGRNYVSNTLQTAESLRHVSDLAVFVTSFGLGCRFKILFQTIWCDVVLVELLSCFAVCMQYKLRLSFLLKMCCMNWNTPTFQAP